MDKDGDTLSDKKIIELGRTCSTTKITCLREVMKLMKQREKKFIKRLKEMIETWHIPIDESGLLRSEIDKLAGDLK